MAKTKNKKKNLSETAVQKKKLETKKPINPFEVHINKDKRQVLGRKSKADRGLPGVARAKAISKRKHTLLNEFTQRDKDNSFMDRRIGERNASMSQEEKIMARYAAEQIKAHKKKNIYSLNDEEVLTHRGQTLEEIEKFEDPKSDDEFSDDENKKGHLDKSFVTDAHFGGGVLSKSDAPLSRKDLIEQLIIESKKRKAEKQKIREQTIDLTEKLDTEWKDLLPLMAASRKSVEEGPVKSKADDYDRAVRELKFESRGMAGERLKSEEEIMREEKEKLESLEQDRLMRMKGLLGDEGKNKHKSADDLDDGFRVEDIEEVDTLAYDEDGVARKMRKGGGKKSDKKFGSGSEEEEDEEEGEEEEEEEEGEGEDDNDAADNNEQDEREEVDGLKIEETSKNDENGDDGDESEDSEEDADDNLSDLKDSESSSEDESPPTNNKIESQSQKSNPEASAVCASTPPKNNKIKPQSQKPIPEASTTSASAPDPPIDSKRVQEIREDLQKRKEMMEKARQELPYTYKAPETFEELNDLLKSQKPDYQSIILERIVKCNHWTLGQGNREKLCKVFNFLLQYLIESAHINDNNNPKDMIKSFEIFDRVAPHLFDLAQANAYSSADCVQTLLKERHEKFEKNQKKYPGLDTLILFKIISLLFPTSDFRHPVVTPAIIFMSQILLRCRVKGKSQISRGLFISTLMLEYTTMSKRFSPAVINYLRGIVFMATEKKPPLLLKIVPPFKRVGELANLLVVKEDQSDLEIDPVGANMRIEDLTDGEIDDKFRIRAFLTAINLTSEFAKQWGELDAVYSIFEPIIKLLRLNSHEKYPKSVQKHVESIREELSALENKKLEYLVKAKKKPKALRLYEPRIERIYDGKKHKPMSKEKAEKEKLMHKLKKEMKGAIREVRKDASFLAKVQIKNQIKNDMERKRKVREIMSEGAIQQAELNEIKRKKN